MYATKTAREKLGEKASLKRTKRGPKAKKTSLSEKKAKAKKVGTSKSVSKGKEVVVGDEASGEDRDVAAVPVLDGSESDQVSVELSASSDDSDDLNKNFSDIIGDTAGASASNMDTYKEEEGNGEEKIVEEMERKPEEPAPTRITWPTEAQILLAGFEGARRKSERAARLKDRPSKLRYAVSFGNDLEELIPKLTPAVGQRLRLELDAGLFKFSAILAKWKRMVTAHRSEKKEMTTTGENGSPPSRLFQAMEQALSINYDAEASITASFSLGAQYSEGGGSQPTVVDVKRLLHEEVEVRKAAQLQLAERTKRREDGVSQSIAQLSNKTTPPRVADDDVPSAVGSTSSSRKRKRDLERSMVGMVATMMDPDSQRKRMKGLLEVFESVMREEKEERKRQAELLEEERRRKEKEREKRRRQKEKRKEKERRENQQLLRGLILATLGSGKDEVVAAMNGGRDESSSSSSSAAAASPNRSPVSSSSPGHDSGHL